MPFAIPSPIVSRVATTATPAHRFFDHLVAAEAGVAGYLHGHVAHAGGTPVLSSPIHSVCFVEQGEIECDVSPLLTAIAGQSWPTSISMTVHAMPQPASATRLANPSGVQRLMGNLIAHAFLTYFENARGHIESKYGKPSGWPVVLNFARMIRNSFGHGGALDIRDPKATATWRGLTFSQTNNGEQVLYNHMATGDVILLMLDTEDLL